MKQHRKLKIGNPKSQKAFALVVILAFVVLLTVLVLAYFSYSALQRQISAASSNQATVDIFAQGAINTIVSDFKQEIFDGSTNFTYGTNTISIPLAPANAAPVPVGTSTNLPNLLKRSAGGLPFSPARAARASTVSSTNASQNGRSISAARWNAALLLPKANPSPTNTTDLTPANFTAPDWIFVNRGGGNPTAWDPNLRTTAATNANTVIGRFAYTIYDEGGLLDVNVAGSPPGITNTITSYKSARAFVDLSQVGLNTNTVSAIVGWRNTASAQPGGNFPDYTFDAVSRTNFLNTLTNSSGFLRTSNTTTNPATGESDRLFISRQQLIQFFSTLADLGLQTKADLQNALQYLGTFSRGLEQPSYSPNPDRPMVVPGTIPSAGSPGGYLGNNRYEGNDDLVNLGVGGFLKVRVLNSFTRVDGTQAVVGEPLVKRKFALSRLQALTTSATASKSNSDPIYQKFGLYRNSASGPWIYDHGGSGRILYLSEVAALEREPDFLELLKAAIHAGSLGKAAPSTQGGNFQFGMDTSGDLQILQIAANLIDQQKTDNYPTRIEWVDSSSATRTVYGVQDLPYFYRWHYFSVTTRLPSPLLTRADKLPTWSIGPARNVTVDHALESATGPDDPGSASYMIIPQIWNPHDANTRSATDGGPTMFRIVAESNDPTGYGVWQIAAQASDGNGNYDGVTLSGTGPESFSITPPIGTYRSFNAANNSAIQFSDSSGGRAFREPTLLWRNGFPAGVSLDFPNNVKKTEDASLTGNTYYGILVGDVPVSWNTVVNGASAILQTSTIRRAPTISGVSANANGNITFRMQYLDASNNWVTYQDAYASSNLTDIPGHTLFVNAAEYNASSGTYYNRFYNPLMIGINASGPQLTAPRGGPYDPRSGRFSTCISGSFDQDDATQASPTLEITTRTSTGNPTSAQNQAVGSSNFVLMRTQRPAASRGQKNNYKLPCSEFGNGASARMGWYSSINWQASGGTTGNSYFFDGLLSQNTPDVKVVGRDNVTPMSIYYEDADGVCRRAAGAYVPVSGNPSGKLTNTGTTVGLPMATSGNTFGGGIVSPSSQSQSRPTLLHRPFKTVGEMSYAFRDIPWKNIDFFTPESGDSALLDVFCINEPPSDALVAGKVNLNTRQIPVIQAILNGAYRDELGTVSPLVIQEAQTLAGILVGITSGNQPWQGPLSNVADLVGRYISPDPGAVSDPSVYQYTSPGTSFGGSVRFTYAGFSAALSGSAAAQDGSDVWTTSPSSSRNIQRFRETPIRALAACGQTRVWNLLIDVVAQSGRFPAAASGLEQFIVEGEQRLWVHLAIDRLTGQVVDRQIEIVSE